MTKVFGFAGSRLFPTIPVRNGLIDRVVSSVLKTGCRIVTGCCIGADAAVLNVAINHCQSNRYPADAIGIFAIGNAADSLNPVGFWQGSALNTVHEAYRLGAFCHWFAGGPITTNLKFRLKARTIAMVEHLANSEDPTLICFPVSRSVGTWGAAMEAAKRGVRVVVFVSDPKYLIPIGVGQWESIPCATGIWEKAFIWSKS